MAAVVVYDDSGKFDFLADAGDLSFEDFEAFLSETAFADIAPTITEFSLDVDPVSGIPIAPEFNKITEAGDQNSEDPRKQNKMMRYDDPIASECSCEKIEHFVEELKDVEAQLGLKRR